jgi:hypothetical protein
MHSAIMSKPIPMLAIDASTTKPPAVANFLAPSRSAMRPWLT